MRSMHRQAVLCAGVEVFDHADSVDAFRAFFSVRGKAMYPKTDVLFKMIREIINTSSLKTPNVFMRSLHR